MMEIKKVNQKSFIVDSDDIDIKSGGINDEIIDWISDNIRECQYYEVARAIDSISKKSDKVTIVIRVYEAC